MEKSVWNIKFFRFREKIFNQNAINTLEVDKNRIFLL